MPNSWTEQVTNRLILNEGLRLFPYRDSMGILTVGVGHNLSSGTGSLRAIGIPQAIADRIVSGSAAITSPEAHALLANDLAYAVDDARASLRKGIYDVLTPARQFTIVDLCFNLGLAGWIGFTGTRSLIEKAQVAKNGGEAGAHELFEQAGQHLIDSAYYTQVGDRAKRNVAMLVEGVWCNPTGNGSDIHKF